MGMEGPVEGEGGDRPMGMGPLNEGIILGVDVGGPVVWMVGVLVEVLVVAVLVATFLVGAAAVGLLAGVVLVVPP